MIRFIPKNLLPYYAVVFVFSMFINILSLFSMLHFYLILTKVIPSGNVASLIFITVLVLIAMAVMSLLEGVRSRLLSRLSNQLDRHMGGTVIQAMFSRKNEQEYDQGTTDLQKIRRFLSGNGIVAFFDLPWLPLFLAAVYVLHPTLGIVATIGAALLLLLLVLNERISSRAVADFSQSSPQSDSFLDLAQRNVQTIYSMGMLPTITNRWKKLHSVDLALETRVHKRIAVSSSSNKALSLILGLIMYSFGAMLVIANQITIGAMIVARIIMGRALMPLNSMLAGWKDFQEARLATNRLHSAIARSEEQISPPEAIRSEGPSGLAVHDLSVSFDGIQVLQHISFELAPGQVLAIQGESGAGKTTLIRTIAGLYTPDQGSVSLDGIDLVAAQDARIRQKYLGYQPQNVDLQSVTVAQNIGRLETDNSEAVIEAAKLAGAHEMILRLPQGYDTKISPKGANLSAGQRQRIALARALYKTPRLVLLDEPDANLDEEGHQALAQAVTELKSRKCIILVVTHHSWITEIQDQELNLDSGSGEMLKKSRLPDTIP